ncbi:hypothetical protein RRG08_043363 [Elysia crispata]|uniref:Uncharacterized protein n=1 Tax=Elysia crispata TaxID=231223 RepID=A0AAE0Z6R1_9GAST|nr:hypothetical protein RRG08_043363 [Elysia crispata]
MTLCSITAVLLCFTCIFGLGVVFPPEVDTVTPQLTRVAVKGWCTAVQSGAHSVVGEEALTLRPLEPANLSNGHDRVRKTRRQYTTGEHRIPNCQFGRAKISLDRGGVGSDITRVSVEQGERDHLYRLSYGVSGDLQALAER